MEMRMPTFYSDPDNMPADYSFTGIDCIFHVGSHLLTTIVDEVYKSHQFQINDSILPNNVSNSTSHSATSRKQIKKEAAIVKSRERDAGARKNRSVAVQGAA
jgi:hypothetical protein